MTTKKTLTLSKKRQDWVKQFKPTAVLQGTALNYNFAVSDRYARALVSLVKQMTAQTNREIISHFKTEHAEEFFSEDASISSSSRILTNSLMKKFNQLFAAKAPKLAVKMIDDSDKASSSALHESLKSLSGGMTLNTKVLTEQMGDIISASITENVSLIKSISSEYFTDVQGAVMRSITTGNGLADLIPFLKQHEGVTLRRATLIASDQTKKIFVNLNAARMKKLGVSRYKWIHSHGGQEPRKLHEQLAGNIFSLEDPPVIQYAKGSLPEVRGKPGDLINCRCRMQPVISFDEGEEK